MKPILAILLLTIGLLISVTYADEYHYKDILIGDRAAGLGGAYVAVSDDPSGMYYNPAGIVYAASQNLNASMNAYNIRQTSYENVVGGEDWVRRSSILLPNFFGITQPLGPGTFGISVAIPDSVIENQDQNFRLNYDSKITGPDTDFTINFNNQDITYNAGPSFALEISDSLSVGLTLYGYTRTQEQIFNQVFEFPLSLNDVAAVEATETTPAIEAVTNTDDVYHHENLYISRAEYGIKPIFGIMLTPFERISLGLSIANTWILSNTILEQRVCTTSLNLDTNFCKKNQLIRSETEKQGTRAFPWELATGIAYFPNNTTMLTTDIVIYKGINASAKPMFNISAGMEHYLTDTFALRLGVYTNNSNTPELVNNVFNKYPEHVDLRGGTISISNFTRSSSLSFGIIYSSGVGEAQIISGSTTIQKAEILSITAFMSASYSL